MTKFTRGIQDHKEAVHGNAAHTGKCEGIARKFPLQDVQGSRDKGCVVCRDEEFVAKLPYATLSLVCKDCFSDPNN